ncbi:unnamed protein product [Amoebophrya sp. A120]|nr:unnamed protein product [Amoebophrya sp. A120]|eukprot:GSA120T00006245001.1
MGDRRPRGRGREHDDDRYTGESGKFERLHDDDDDACKSIEGWVIVISGIHEETQEEDLYERFSDFGSIKNIHLNLDRKTGYVKGYCFLEYQEKEEAMEAIKNAHGDKLLGATMTVSWAFQKKDTGDKPRKKARRH